MIDPEHWFRWSIIIGFHEVAPFGRFMRAAGLLVSELGCGEAKEDHATSPIIVDGFAYVGRNKIPPGFTFLIARGDCPSTVTGSGLGGFDAAERRDHLFSVEFDGFHHLLVGYGLRLHDQHDLIDTDVLIGLDGLDAALRVAGYDDAPVG